MAELFISREQAESNFLDCAAFIAERIKSSDGHAEAMGSVLPGYLARGDVDMAAELANAIDEPFSRDKLITLVAEKCAEISDNEYELQLADAVEDQGLRAQALERIALIAAAKGEIDTAREIAIDMAHPDFVYAGIAVRQAADGNREAADATIDEIEFPTASVSALQQIAARYIGLEQWDDASEVLDKAIDAANEIGHDEEKIRALCDIGNQYIDARQNDKAIDTFDLAVEEAQRLDNMHRDYFFVSSALGYLHAGVGDRADATLDMVTDKTHMASALSAFAREHWKQGEKEQAIDTIEEAYEILRSQKDSETRDSRSRNVLHSAIAVQFVGFGKTDRGVEIALENADPSERISALSQIAGLLTVRNEDQLAHQTLDNIEDDADRMFALITMSDSKQSAGDQPAAISLLDEAVSMAGSVEQLTARSGAYSSIADRMAQYGETERARAISVDNLQTVADIRDQSSQAAALSAIHTVYENGGIDIGDAEREIIRTILRKIA